MKIDIIEPVGRAIQTTRRILFSPFDFVKWCGMGFTAMLGADFFTFSGVNSLPAGDDDGGNADAFAKARLARRRMGRVFEHDNPLQSATF